MDKKRKINEKALAEMRITLDEIISECRQSGIADISDVNYIILEPNGKMSILPNASKSPLTPSDMGIKTEERGLMHPLIIDGKLVSKSPEIVGLDKDSVERLCHARHLEIKDVLLVCMDDRGTILCYKKEEIQ